MEYYLYMIYPTKILLMIYNLGMIYTKFENKDVIGLLIGNKIDLERKVNIEEAKKFAEEMD